MLTTKKPWWAFPGSLAQIERGAVPARIVGRGASTITPAKRGSRPPCSPLDRRLQYEVGTSPPPTICAASTPFARDLGVVMDPTDWEKSAPWPTSVVNCLTATRSYVREPGVDRQRSDSRASVNSFLTIGGAHGGVHLPAGSGAERALPSLQVRRCTSSTTTKPHPPQNWTLNDILTPVPQNIATIDRPGPGPTRVPRSTSKRSASVPALGLVLPHDPAS